MMNNPFVIAQSQAFAQRLIERSNRVADQIESAFLLAYGRPPTHGERTAAASFLRNFSAEIRYGNRQADTLAALCQGLFASAEFRYID